MKKVIYALSFASLLALNLVIGINSSVTNDDTSLTMQIGTTNANAESSYGGFAPECAGYIGSCHLSYWNRGPIFY